MVKARKFLAPSLVCFAVAACATENPAAATTGEFLGVRAPSQPLFDGGHMLGSGAAVDTTREAAAASYDAAATDTTGRGGHMLGSGS